MRSEGNRRQFLLLRTRCVCSPGCGRGAAEGGGVARRHRCRSTAAATGCSWPRWQDGLRSDSESQPDCASAASLCRFRSGDCALAVSLSGTGVRVASASTCPGATVQPVPTRQLPKHSPQTQNRTELTADAHSSDRLTANAHSSGRLTADHRYPAKLTGDGQTSARCRTS
jgi:hypothetical protein